VAQCRSHATAFDLATGFFAAGATAVLCAGGCGEPEAAAAADKEAEAIEEVQKRKYNRASEIQELKNQRYLAETHRGLLLLRNPPAGTYGAYVKKVTDEENTDRMKLMTSDAAKAREELQKVMSERYAANLKSAHAGEWIEVADPAKPQSYKLEQKR